jgi:hypothetical protein
MNRCDETAFHNMCNVTDILVIGKDVISCLSQNEMCHITHSLLVIGKKCDENWIAFHKTFNVAHILSV